jgi:hypothetical protein
MNLIPDRRLTWLCHAVSLWVELAYEAETRRRRKAMIHHGRLCLVLITLLTACPFDALCETYTQTVDFNANQAYTYNNVWKHTLSQIPQGHKIQSAQISLRVQVWYWGWNSYEQNIDIMASDTNSFALPQDRVCELNPTTNPGSSTFYTVTCQLPSEKLDFIANDHEIYFGTNTYGGTYYVDYTTLTVNTALPAQYVLSVNVDPDGSGAVTLEPPGGTYNEGTVVSLTAAKASGYVFDYWTGDVADTFLAATTSTMDANQTVVAHFAADRDNDGVKDTADGCPDDANKTAPGQCGCGQAEIDTDGDTLADCVDPDDDSDGMPDSWEIANGLNPLVNDANLDKDGDGFTNLREYRAGSKPNDPNSIPKTATSLPFIPLLLE